MASSPGDKRVLRARQARRDRRNQLLESATAVFAKKGFRDASITDIIENAGVARGTFYLHFRSKNDILSAIVDELREKQKLLIRQISDEGDAQVEPEAVRKQARQAVLIWLQFYYDHQDATRILLREAGTIDSAVAAKRQQVRNAAKSFIVKRVRRLQDAGFYQKESSPEMISHFIVGMMDEITESCILRGHRDLEWMADQLVEFELNGLLPRR